MRGQLFRLRKGNSTRGERRIGELLKRNRIKFQVKARVGKFEIDFLAGKVAIEIDGSIHKTTNAEKDIYLFSEGYIPLHIRTQKYNKETEKELLYLIKSNNKKI